MLSGLMNFFFFWNCNDTSWEAEKESLAAREKIQGDIYYYL
jgi:hypothetical protein